MAAASQQHWQPALTQNVISLKHYHTASAIVAGSLAGILGLTNLVGFLFVLAANAAATALFLVLSCSTAPSSHFAQGIKGVLKMSAGEGLATTILFWTLMYSLVHVYD